MEYNNSNNNSSSNNNNENTENKTVISSVLDFKLAKILIS